MAINTTTKKHDSSRSRLWYQAGFLVKTKINRRRLQAIGFGSVWAATLLFGAVTTLMAIIPAQTVHADNAPTNYFWMNNQTIRGQEDQSSWIDVNVTDGTRTYVRQNQKLKCNNELRTPSGYGSKTDFIDVDRWDDVKGTGKGTVYWFTEATTAGSSACVGHKKDITIGSVDPEFFITYVWIDSNTIRHSFTSYVGKMGSGEDNTNTWDTDDYILSTTAPNTGLYMAQKGGECRDYITSISSDKKTAQIVDNQISGSGCAPANKYTLQLGFPDNAKVASDAKDGAAGGSKGSAAPEKSCETKNAGDGIGWVLCAVLRGLDGSIAWIDDQIQDLLVIKMSYFNDPSFVQAWGTIRNISLLVLVPIMLVMVIATALEMGPFDAYTVKKALPRFMIAVLFIVLSLPLLKFLVQLSNVVETGVLGLITSAFGTNAQNITLASLFNPDTGDTVVAGTGVFLALAAGTAAFATGAVTIGIIFSFALVAFVGLLVGYLVLLIRVLLVVALVLVAPLAILPWIFPGNDKLWGIWKNTLTTLLLLGPVLGALIGAGRILAKITPDNQWYFKIFFYIVVYFLILTTIKSFGGLAGTILNWGNGQARGFFDKQRKYREGTRAENWRQFKAGDRDTLVGRNRMVRAVGRRVGVGSKGRFGFGAKGREAVALQSATATKATMEHNAWMGELANNDAANAIMALSGGRQAGARRARDRLADTNAQFKIAQEERKLNRTLTETERAKIINEQREAFDSAYNAANAVGFSEARAQAALTTMAQNKSRAVVPGDFETIQQGIDRLAAGNESRKAGLGFNYQFHSRGAGRLDLGGSWNGVKPDQKGKNKVILDGLGRTPMSTVVQGHTNQVRQATETIKDVLTSSTSSYEDRETAALRLIELQNNMPYATGENQQVINNLVDELKLKRNNPIEFETAQYILGPGATQEQVTERATSLRSRARTIDASAYERSVSMPGDQK